MPDHLALLRAVNVGEGTGLRMTALRELFEREGLREVRTLRQSGNVVFADPREPGPGLEERLSAAIESELGVRTGVFVRSAVEWAGVIRDNPFVREAGHDPHHLVVYALRAAPPEAAWSALSAAHRGPERIAPGGRHAYVTYPDGIGRSKLTNRFLEEKLGTAGTGRNWNTVRELGALLAGPGPVAAPRDGPRGGRRR